MSTLAVVEEILRETAVPMSVREIVERAGVRLPSKSKTPDTVVARDLAMDIKKKGDASLFTRTSPRSPQRRSPHSLHKMSNVSRATSRASPRPRLERARVRPAAIPPKAADTPAESSILVLWQ
jgi:hypothetical protein